MYCLIKYNKELAQKEIMNWIVDKSMIIDRKYLKFAFRLGGVVALLPVLTIWGCVGYSWAIGNSPFGLIGLSLFECLMIAVYCILMLGPSLVSFFVVPKLIDFFGKNMNKKD